MTGLGPRPLAKTTIPSMRASAPRRSVSGKRCTGPLRDDRRFGDKPLNHPRGEGPGDVRAIWQPFGDQARQHMGQGVKGFGPSALSALSRPLKAFAIQGRQIRQGLVTAQVTGPLVGEQLLGLDAPMTAHRLEADIPALKQANQERP